MTGTPFHWKPPYQRIAIPLLSRVLCLSLAFGLTGLPLLTPLAKAQTLKGGVVVTDETPDTPNVNPDDWVEVEKGDVLDMNLATVLTSSLSQEGDEFFGKLRSDYRVDGKLVLPRGTLVHGIIDGVSDPKRMGRNGHMQMRFDYLITPDGREIPIEGQHDTKGSKGKEIMQVAGRAATFTIAGGAIGALMVVKYGGLAAVAASEGYALAGGAAVGAGLGLAAAALTKGKHAMLEPGAQLQIKLADGMSLPTMEDVNYDAQVIELDGLNVDVLGQRLDKDPFGEEKELTLSLDIVNQTRHSFSTFDMVLMDEYGTQFHPSPFGDTGIWFGKLKPNSRLRGNISFSIDDPKGVHYLVFYKQYSREVLAKLPIDPRVVEAETAEKNKPWWRRDKKSDSQSKTEKSADKTESKSVSKKASAR